MSRQKKISYMRLARDVNPNTHPSSDNLRRSAEAVQRLQAFSEGEWGEFRAFCPGVAAHFVQRSLPPAGEVRWLSTACVLAMEFMHRLNPQPDLQALGFDAPAQAARYVGRLAVALEATVLASPLDAGHKAEASFYAVHAAGYVVTGIALATKTAADAAACAKPVLGGIALITRDAASVLRGRHDRARAFECMATITRMLDALLLNAAVADVCAQKLQNMAYTAASMCLTTGSAILGLAEETRDSVWECTARCVASMVAGSAGEDAEVSEDAGVVDLTSMPPNGDGKELMTCLQARLREADFKADVFRALKSPGISAGTLALLGIMDASEEEVQPVVRRALAAGLAQELMSAQDVAVRVDPSNVKGETRARVIAAAMEACCAVCGAESRANSAPGLFVCGGCRRQRYCSEDCQRIHWRERGHSTECANLRAAGQSRQPGQPRGLQVCNMRA